MTWRYSMTNLETVEKKFEEIDQQVIQLLSQNITPEHSQIAIDTYMYGLMLREVALAELELRDTRHQTLLSLLKSDAFARAVLLIFIPIAKAGCGQIAKTISNIRR